MPRKNVWDEVDSMSLGYLDYVEVAHVVEKLTEVLNDHPGARIVKSYYAYEDNPYLSIQAERPETDKEMAAREAQEEQIRQQQEARERADFERLNKKYGGTQ